MELFADRCEIPHDGEFVRLFPYVEDHAFPAAFSDGWMSKALAPARLGRIRAEILAGGGDMIKVNVGAAGPQTKCQVDWIASHSVLEHVEDLEPMYRLFNLLLAPDGVMTHLIDFSSHGLTRAWNGHWALNDLQWTILRGRRTYLINRHPLERHQELLARNRFAATMTRLHRRVDGFLKASFKSPFDRMSSVDASTHMAFMVVEKLSA